MADNHLLLDDDDDHVDADALAADQVLNIYDIGLGDDIFVYTGARSNPTVD